MSPPISGRVYIIDSFMVVVFGGVGNMGRGARRALPRGRQQIPRTLCRGDARQDFVLILLILFIQGRPRGLFPLKGGASGGMMLAIARPQ